MYRIFLLLWVTTAATQSSYNVDSRGSSFLGKSNNLGPLYTPGLGAASSSYRDDSYEDNAVTPTPVPPPIYRQSQQPLYRKPTSSSDGTIRIVSGLRGGPPRNGPYDKNAPREEPLEEEKDEPDRLSLLLPQSKFDCIEKQTGYYADEDLNCEVFHYCHDNAKHSWICPEGFTFHQVHLICMPPSGDINCKKSSKYHFVNEYLYKPLNQEEAETKPNVTLRYSERYYPGDIFTDERESEEYEPSSNLQKRPSHQQSYLSQHSPTGNSLPSASRPVPHSFSQFRAPANQVFRSPEEVNIPLQQRRPQQQQQILRRFPTIRPEEDYE
ncbi:uncharacterized protein LOC107042836 [Diachasma alloeum]|uniref:uncharacterized protein LOC107042836 n=1 Tax=Diachasma alloeum TaxID=454923 RepID=UPI0007382CB5|nr:uncharacterized protein LOC107042836 [Diachasma alloeum]